MFNADHRKVLDASLPLALRYRKFLHCLEWYCYLTRQSFQATYHRFGCEFGFDWKHKPGEEQLRKAVTLLSEERAGFLKKLEAFAESRMKEKEQGQWQPRKAQVIKLYTPDWLLTHDSEAQRQH